MLAVRIASDSQGYAGLGRIGLGRAGGSECGQVRVDVMRGVGSLVRVG